MMYKNRVPVAIAALLALSACGVIKGGHKKTPTLGDRVPILMSESEVTADKTLGDVQVLLPPAAANDSWAQPGGSASKSMGQLALGGTLSRAWSAQIDGGSNRQRLAASPVIADGKLFAMDVDATVHAFGSASGNKLWSTTIAKADKKARSARFGGGVSYDDGKVYAADGLGDVVALNATTGAELWRAKPGGPLRGAPSISDGNLYVLSQDNQLFALSLADGSVVWTQSGSIESQGVFGVAAPAAGQGTVIAGFSSGELNAYRYENGHTLWQDALSRSSISTSVSSLADIDADPVIDRGLVFAVGQGGRTVALEIVSGQRIWEQNFAGISTPWVAGEWLFLVTDDARLVCLARATGKVRWIHQLRHYKSEKGRKNPYTWYGPVLAGNRLILTNSRGQIVSVAPETGEEGAVIDDSKGFSLPPVVANSTLYVLDQKGRISAYR